MGRGDRGGWSSVKKETAKPERVEEEQVVAQVLEMPKFPERAGVALIKSDENALRPSRDGEVITLPRAPDSELFPLMEGEQFLFLKREENRRPSWLYFGGTDEAPFLVELNTRIFGFMTFGEEFFYEALKPQRIHEAEIVWGKKRTKRQGDIFAYHLPFSWKELLQRVFYNTHCLPENVRESVFGTRHTLTGLKVPLRTFESRHSGFQPMILNGIAMWEAYEGIIEAPDHAPLLLEGPHILGQASFLEYSRDAD